MKNLRLLMLKVPLLWSEVSIKKITNIFDQNTKKVGKKRACKVTVHFEISDVFTSFQLELLSQIKFWIIFMSTCFRMFILWLEANGSFDQSWSLTWRYEASLFLQSNMQVVCLLEYYIKERRYSVFGCCV